ncbi:MAG TPA: hypothetical protein VM100_01455, partial [Longimicrobiales bacterium]|nr:hypothetical protein [Longimicrobiales bacterium]
DGITVTNDAARSELVFDFPHVTLAHGSMLEPEIMAAVIPMRGYLHGFSIELVTMDGDVVPNSLIHHVNIIAPNRRELFSHIMQRVGAAGAETGPLQFPKFIGYPVSQGDSLIFSVMLHNQTERNYEHVMLRVRFKYSKPSTVAPVVAFQPFYMDVMPPAGVHAYNLPAGKSSKSWEGSPAIPGRVIALGGHMHKFGTRMVLEDVTAGKTLWETTPQTDSTGQVIGMPRKLFFGSLGLQIVPTHVYRITVYYDNPTGAEIEEGAMGTLGGLFVPDDRALWPAVDRTNPEYIADVNVTYDKKSAAAGMMHHH